MRRSVCMSELTESAELRSPATPPQKPARPRAEVSSAEASTAEASSPPVTVQNGPVPDFELKVGDKKVTAVGLWMGFSVFLTAIAVQIPILGAWLYSEATDDPPQTGTRRGIDYIIGFWAFASMSMSGYRPRVVGVENLPEGACVYAPNHASFLDILTLTGFVPRPLKYVSKASILDIPFIGWPMQLAEHIPLNQASRRSQLETFKQSVSSLEAGNAIVAFPEGSRSPDGVLQPFKRGPFKMAMRAGVPVVPVTISDLARWYPKGTLLPIGVPTDVVVTIHPPISMTGENMVDESAAMAQTYDAVNSALPLYQRGPPHKELK